MFLGSYPITPASDILHELSKHKNFGVRTLQAEDEIAGIGAALGAAFGGHLGVTTTSGPGIALKAETIGLAVSLELPLLIIDIQRGGPVDRPAHQDRGRPTCCMAMYGRHGESPLPIVAAYSPSHCFDAAIEAARIALKYRTPVILLSDGYLANGSEPWRLPDVDDLPDISRRRSPPSPTTSTPTATRSSGPTSATPRPWPGRGPSPARPASMHRIGGIEKEDGTGNISYDPANHERMVAAAGRQGRRHRQRHPAGRGRRRRRRRRAARARLGLDLGRHRRRASTGAAARGQQGGPAPTSSTSTRSRRTSARCCARYPQVLVPEMNLGQLVAAAPGRVPRRRPVGHQGAGRARSPPASSKPPSSRSWEPDVTDTDRAPPTTAQGLVQRPGGPLVPGLRRLLDPHRRAAADARARRAPREHRVRVRHRLRRPLPVLHEHLRDALIHGRAPAIATGLAMARPDLDVWVVSGDGDVLSIGGNHLIHALRRNVNLTILLFNNQIYGLTKGQYSPTSEVGQGHQVDAVRLARPAVQPDQPWPSGAEATFVARTHDMDRKHMMEMFRRAHDHQGAAFVEIYQNCNVFNDGAFEAHHRQGRPRRRCSSRSSTASRSASAPTASKGVVARRPGPGPHRRRGRRRRGRILVHDEARDEPGLAFMLSRLSTGPHRAHADRRVPRRRAARLRRRDQPPARRGPGAHGPADLAALLHSRPTWEV